MKIVRIVFALLLTGGGALPFALPAQEGPESGGTVPSPEKLYGPQGAVIEGDEENSEGAGENSEEESGDGAAVTATGEGGSEGARPPEGQPKEKSQEQLREEMLERLADQLSRRMRALREREEALAARESALTEREKEEEERERSLGDIEELMQLREEVVKRRENLPPPQSWNAPEGVPSIYGQFAAVLDGKTMQFYHKKAADARTPVASTQKLVTALIVCNEGDLDGYATVPELVNDVEPTKIGVEPGEKYTRRELLTALLVRSGNDIAATLAVDNAGSVERFIDKMNAFARSIGMTDSNFRTPHGLPADGQYSTARDIAIAAFEAYHVPDIREIIQMRTYTFRFNDGEERILYNTNRVLGRFPGCNGMKTGYTHAAGKCLVSSAEVDGEHRIAVVIKSGGDSVWTDSQKLLDWSFAIEKTGPLPGTPGLALGR